MVKFLGLLLLTSFIIRALAAGLFTVDIAGTAGLVQDTGGYLFQNPQQQNERSGIRIPYNPNSGRVGSQNNGQGDTPLNSFPRATF